MSGANGKAALYRCGLTRQCQWYAVFNGNILMWWNWKIGKWQGSVHSSLERAASFMGANHQPEFVAMVRLKS